MTKAKKLDYLSGAGSSQGSPIYNLKLTITMIKN